MTPMGINRDSRETVMKGTIDKTCATCAWAELTDGLLDRAVCKCEESDNYKRVIEETFHCGQWINARDVWVKKTCFICKWVEQLQNGDLICVNRDSPNSCDFTFDTNKCDFWEERK